jgi:hypothetical protein
VTGGGKGRVGASTFVSGGVGSCGARENLMPQKCVSKEVVSAVSFESIEASTFDNGVIMLSRSMWRSLRMVVGLGSCAQRPSNFVSTFSKTLPTDVVDSREAIFQ